MLGLGFVVGAIVGPFVSLGSLAKWQQRYGRGNENGKHTDKFSTEHLTC